MDETIKTIIEKVIKGDTNALIGLAEGRTIEAKRAPYDLTKPAKQLELAKDVTSFANASGGVLLLGYSTEKDELHQDDIIKSLSPIPSIRFDKTQYLQILRNLTWPHVEVEIHVIKIDSESCVVIIAVPAAPMEKRPILVTRYLPDDADKTTDTVFGYYERTRSDNFAFDPKRMHAIIRNGLFYEDTIRSEFETLRLALANGQLQQRLPDVEDSSQIANDGDRRIMRLQQSLSDVYAQTDISVDKLVEQALRAAELIDVPVMVLVAHPKQPMNLRRLFASRNDEIARLVENPPEIRGSGFGLDTGGRSEIVAGRLRRSVAPGHSLLEIHRDGTVIYIVSATTDGLGWGSEKQQPFRLRVNQVAFIEKVYLFSVLVSTVSNSLSAGNVKGDIAVLFRNLEHNGVPAELRAGRIDSWHLSRSGIAPTPDADILEEDLILTSLPEETAFLLAARVYAWFGLDESAIPYTTEVDGQRAIDPEAIRSL